MKWFHSRFLFNINQELSSICSTERHIYTRVECFTVDQNDFPESEIYIHSSYEDFTDSSGDARSLDDVLPISQYAPQQHYSVLLSAISCSFPDFDFSSTTPYHFKVIQSPEQAKSSIIWNLTSSLPLSDTICKNIWQNIDNEISPALCDIYSYEPDQSDAFSEMGALWSRCFLFFNTKQRKVLLFHLREGAQEFESEDEDVLFNEDDIIDSFGYSYY